MLTTVMKDTNLDQYIGKFSYRHWPMSCLQIPFASPPSSKPLKP